MRLAVDAMGGDYAPQEIVAGAVQALSILAPEDRIVLIGQEPRIRQVLAEIPEWTNDPRLEIVHAADIIEMGDHPIDALRHKKDNSISRMAELAAEGKADAVISAGNTGACVAACQMKIRPLQGVHRPAIAVMIPSFGGPVVLCDCGANPMPKPHHLHQYALMACVYAREVLKNPHPTVGLVSIGSEDAKGNELVKKTNHILREDTRFKFVGNVETREFLNRPADVVVCDGFVGNVILKLTEGLAAGLFKTIMLEIEQINPSMVEHFKPVIKSLYAKHDYNEYGGAPLMGINGTCIICHGSSDARAIKNAIKAACRQAENSINGKIAELLKENA